MPATPIGFRLTVFGVSAALLVCNVAGLTYLLSDITRIAAVAPVERSAGFLLPVPLGGPTRPLGMPVDNQVLEEVYTQALRQVRSLQPAALLSRVGITLVPYADTPGVVVTLSFYSRPLAREADRSKGWVLDYEWSPSQAGRVVFAGELTAPMPDRQAPFQEPPWRSQPRWPEFVNRVASLTRPAHHPYTTFQVWQSGNDPAHNWSLLIRDGEKKEDRHFHLRGSQILEGWNPFLRADLELLARVFVSAEYLGPVQVLRENAAGELLQRIESGQFPDRIGPGTILGVTLIPLGPRTAEAVVHLLGYDQATYYERLRLERLPPGWRVTALSRHFL